MTTHYLDIHIRPDLEFSGPVLMGALLSKFHRVLVEMKVYEIGISFPEYQLHPRSLGEHLRLHGNEQHLRGLMERRWLKGMSDHIELSMIQCVPSSVEYRVVRRRQYKTNVDRLRRRRMKRKGEGYAQAVAAIPDYVQRTPELPFFSLLSQSTGQRFSLFIEQGELRTAPTHGKFNLYGLSTEATIPWF
ncbi:type I-F CRISPR-associated endoribonuclease Cas6/Csy4 [Microbulbifer sp.]|uniref:type I-F CRISPR-associated endoribonuclease Cas6/Csy4 n=1 Tax=Microbulbifer sp. TaxID=1908541 RepID=UPI00258A7FF4|nr:type I-F CRISPR-associated endoribonuclease Cas6/Csy4 [Microbulbifer sp.]